MRLFVALDIDAEIRRRIEEFRDRMRPYAPDVRWVSPDTFHITLAVSWRDREARSDSRCVAAGSRSGDPHNVSRHRILSEYESRHAFSGSASMQPTGLQQLVNNIGDALEPLGFKQERTPFTPHLTLARSGSGRPRPVRGESSAHGLRVVAIKLEDQPPSEFGSMTAREFCLYESQAVAVGSEVHQAESISAGVKSAVRKYTGSTKEFGRFTAFRCARLTECYGDFRPASCRSSWRG